MTGWKNLNHEWRYLSHKVLDEQIAGWPVKNEGMKLYMVVMGIRSLIF